MRINTFSIKDLENLSGIKAHTIRIWEQRYSFLKPQRSKSNIRFYGNDELKTVLNIALLNKYGYKISHINRMAPDEVRDKIISLSDDEAYEDKFINELLKHMVDLDVERFEETTAVYTRAKGVGRAITRLILPFLDKIGILWFTNQINIAQEHMVTNVIRQKLMAGIESVNSYAPCDKMALLFLPEGEHRELGLLYLYYLLKCRGIQVIYLGGDVPLKEIEFVAHLKQPDYIFTHLTHIPGRFSIEKFIHQMAQRIPSASINISGRVTRSYQKKIPANIILQKSIEDLTRHVKSL
jgi:MerR family transcriptional regulator, light-induced transcriptional regulator